MNLLVFGGSFDPVHKGHLITAQKAQTINKYDAVWFVPCQTSRYDKNMASFEDRTEMLARAIFEFGNKTFDICAIEETMNIQGKMYDLAKSISSSFPTIEIDFLIGSDTLYKMEDWYRFDDLCEEFVFLVAERLGYPFVDIGLRQIPMKNHLDYNISSTQVKEELSKTGKSLLVYDDTLNHIKEKGLYGIQNFE